MRYLIIVFLVVHALVNAQQKNDTILPSSKTILDSDTLVVDNGKKDSMKVFKPTIQDYLYKTETSEYKTTDTTLSMHHSYAYSQYNNRDNFGKIQFANIGSGFQDLQYTINKEAALKLMPTNKSYGILSINDIQYYDVKTPTTYFLYHTAMRNGAALDSRYTQNIGKNFNFAIEYMGLRSQGFYTNSLAANSNVILSTHFKTNNKKYEFFAHFLHQNVRNEENGGIKDLSLFEGDDDRFNNRQNIPVNLVNSNSRFSNRRYYFSHSYLPFNKEAYPFKINHQFYYQSMKYDFSLGNSDGEFFENYNPEWGNNTKKYAKDMSNTFRLVFDKSKFYLDAGVKYQSLKLGDLANSPQGEETTEYKENRFGLIGNLKVNLWDRVALKSALEYSNGKQFGNFIRSDNQLKIEFIKDFFIDANVFYQNAAPSFNYLLNASPVTNYNYNFTDFKNENVIGLSGKLDLKWFNTSLFVNYYRVDNFAYFTENAQPRQSASALKVSQIGGEGTFDMAKFHLNVRLQFQSTLSNQDLLPTPKLIGRANLYYQTPLFEKAAELIGGIKVYYFSKFASRQYAPILNEFILPSAKDYRIGGQPIADAFINLKVKTMQIYVEGQNLNSTFMKNKSYTAPFYPLYDFRLNIGILWNLFH